jgi:hypothetical protein
MDILLAVLRKLIFIALLFGGWIFIDRFYLTGFKIEEVLKDDQKAIAILLGLLAVALAIA